jgi:hypothetical protein
LCNRVYPTRNNNLISDLNIRSGILQAIYDSMKNRCMVQGALHLAQVRFYPFLHYPHSHIHI